MEVSKSKIFGIRMLEAERLLISAAAKSEGKSPSEWAREILVAKASQGIIVEHK